MNAQEIYNKRIEEAAKKAKTDFLNRFNWSGNQETGFNKGAIWMLGNLWISVDEALPKKSEEYLVTNGVYFKVADFNADGMYWDNEPFLGCRAGSQEVTHWMKIPEIGGEK